MRRVFAALIIVSVVLCGGVRADVKKNAKEVEEFVKVSKGPKGNVLTITGRIQSKHARFSKGRSVKTYLIVTPDMQKIPLPRSHVEHRDGTVSGIQFRPVKGKTVEIVCKGRVKDSGKKGKIVTVTKVVSLKIVAKTK